MKIKVPMPCVFLSLVLSPAVVVLEIAFIVLFLLFGVGDGDLLVPSVFLMKSNFLVKRYGIREIHFLDDNISVSRDRLEKICDGIIQKKLNIKWTCPNGIAIWTLNKRLLKKMKKVVVIALLLGLSLVIQLLKNSLEKI